MYNDYLETYLEQCMALSDNKKSKLGNKYDPANLFLLDIYNYDAWFKNQKSTDATRKNDKEKFDMPPLEGDEEVKEGKGLKI